MQLKHFILCFLFFLLGQNPDEETITWNESHKLTWADFKGPINPSSDAIALTASGITFGFSISTSGSKIVDYDTTVEAHFYPNKSWCNKKKANQYILGHEQLHFDITELYARIFRQRLTKLRVNQNIKKQLKTLHNAINSELNETQKRYDAQSVHSINTEVQHQWQTFIQVELEKLKEFKSF
ncbi:DUF922 domain-containing protein [Winogradskyella alexanderae]|uniref:DUF922 domain-containing protein n=1 Tax=Winogradskyella alexanderae TaxID=2877123 RepID=A0ABS7XPU2_9FLAO|nr:DUF922 domain-containing protein [Winogradskyella alexanderae]MCA0132025.1 DUF922 domain-containing protein [Winogradskyella alexanderae]